MDCLQTVNELNTLVIEYPDFNQPPEELPKDGKNGEGFYACTKEITVSTISKSDLAGIENPREKSLVIDIYGSVYQIDEIMNDTIYLSARLFKISPTGGGSGSEVNIAIITNADIDKIAV